MDDKLCPDSFCLNLEKRLEAFIKSSLNECLLNTNFMPAESWVWRL
jgi:hypothetical protein